MLSVAVVNARLSSRSLCITHCIARAKKLFNGALLQDFYPVSRQIDFFLTFCSVLMESVEISLPCPLILALEGRSMYT